MLMLAQALARNRLLGQVLALGRRFRFAGVAAVLLLVRELALDRHFRFARRCWHGRGNVTSCKGVKSRHARDDHGMTGKTSRHARGEIMSQHGREITSCEG